MQAESPGAPPPRVKVHQGLRDALFPLLVAMAGGLAMTVIFEGRGNVVLAYASHAWYLAAVGGWVLIFRLRFPLGGLSWQALRGWFGPWFIVGGLYLLLALVSPGPPLRHAILAGLIFQGVVVGPTEEVLFRGLIQTTLNRVIGGAIPFGRLRWGTIVAALTFGLAHLASLPHQSLGDTLAQVAFAAVVGLVLGHYYDRTQNLWGAAILHNIIDLTSVLVPLLIVH